MSSGTPDEKKPSPGGIGGWMSNRGLIAKVSFAFVGAIFILIIIVGAAYYPSMDEPEPSPGPGGISTPSVSNTSVSNNLPVPISQSISTQENMSTDITLTAYDKNANDTLSARIVSRPLNGVLGDINQTSGVVTYTPDQGFTGTDQFSFQVNDGNSDSSNNATVSIQINATN